VKTYVVKKGDNPVIIAKKLKVSYSDLIALNHIEDPRKLHIGQKLLVRETANWKTTSAKATNRKKNKYGKPMPQATSHRSHRIPREANNLSVDGPEERQQYGD